MTQCVCVCVCYSRLRRPRYRHWPSTRVKLPLRLATPFWQLNSDQSVQLKQGLAASPKPHDKPTQCVTNPLKPYQETERPSASIASKSHRVTCAIQLSGELTLTSDDR